MRHVGPTENGKHVLYGDVLFFPSRLPAHRYCTSYLLVVQSDVKQMTKHTCLFYESVAAL